MIDGVNYIETTSFERIESSTCSCSESLIKVNSLGTGVET